ncbi:glutaredoxin family protein [Vibrio sp.]|uniref:glutaredoxin family protein n=1 Tax=Vibrio sp. TaxID=678 RepID=UPI003AA9A143
MLTLYSTSGCHLCELAYQQLDTLWGEDSQQSLAHTVQVIDIAFDDALFDRYGVTIPVLALHSQDIQNDQNNLQHQSNLKHIQSELFWPFNLDELQAWLKHNGINYHS